VSGAVVADLSGETIKPLTAIVVFCTFICLLFYFAAYKPTLQCEAKTCPELMSPIRLEGHCICVIQPK